MLIKISFGRCFMLPLIMLIKMNLESYNQIKLSSIYLSNITDDYKKHILYQYRNLKEKFPDLLTRNIFNVWITDAIDSSNINKDYLRTLFQVSMFCLCDYD